jgi:hypothetical protein
VTDLHRYVAYAIPAGFALLVLWAVVSLVRNKAPGDRFWTLLAILQTVLGLQVVVGGILFLLGHRATPQGPEWLHYVYGGLFPVVVLAAAHRFSRRHESIAWIVFGIAALVNFGLTFRALQTGLGVD